MWKKKKKKSKEEDKKTDEDQYVRWGSSATRQGNGDVAKDQKTSARKNSSAVTAGEARNHGHLQIPSARMMTRVCAAACPPSHNYQRHLCLYWKRDSHRTLPSILIKSPTKTGYIYRRAELWGLETPSDNPLTHFSMGGTRWEA